MVKGFRINLNKFGHEQKQKEAQERNFVILFAVLIGLLVASFGWLFLLDGRLNDRIDNRQQLYDQISREINRLESSETYVSEADIHRLSEEEFGRIRWAELLARFSEYGKDAFKIESLEFKHGRLALKGVMPLKSGEVEVAKIYEIMDWFRNDPFISDVFPDIEFGYAHRKTMNKNTIISFGIDMKTKMYRDRL